MREAAHEIARRRADWAPSFGDRLAAALLGLARPGAVLRARPARTDERWEHHPRNG